MKKRGKKGALELSIGTIVIIVLAMSMLILGIVLIRTIMCGAVGLTGELNNKIKGQIDDLFQSEGGEVVCVGSGSNPVVMIPGEYNTVYCAFKARQAAEYNIKVVGLRGGSILKERDIEQWIAGDDFWKGNIAPGDEIPKKTLRLNVPENAPQDLILIDVEIYKDGDLISSQQLDFEIKRIGFFRAAVC